MGGEPGPRSTRLWYSVVSVCLSSVCNVYIVAKRYVLLKGCLKKQVGLPDCFRVVPRRTPYDPPFPNGGTDCTPNTCISKCGLQLAAWLH